MSPKAINKILSALPPDERLTLIDQAELVSSPATHVIYHAGDPLTTAYFPATGLAAAFALLPSGDHVAVATTGSEGLLGMPVILDVDHSPHQIRVTVASTGYRIPAATVRQMFDRSEIFRRLVLEQLGRIYIQVERSAVCNRFHSQRQRVSRWLLVIAGKTDRTCVALTHEQLANMVGGPRHAVTSVIAGFRAKGLVQQVRGAIEVLDPVALSKEACDCYRTDLNLP